MKTLNTTPISDSARFPIKKGTLKFLQDAHKEVFASLIKSLIGPAYNPAVVYVMSGVENSAVAPIYNVSAGAIFFNGEVYDFDGAGFTVSGGNVAVFSVIQSQYTTDADPVTFTDLTSRNVHDIKKMQLTQALTGTGISDFATLFRLSFQIPAQVNITAPVSAPYVGNQLQVIGSYPNHILYVPPSSNLNPVLAAGSTNIGDVSPGGTDIAVVFSSALLTSNYIVTGSIISSGTPSQDTTIVWTIRNRTTTGFTARFAETTPTSQNVAFEWLVFAK